MTMSELKLSLRRIVARALFRSSALKALNRIVGPPWRILTYHRVMHPESSPFPIQPGMYVRPETFVLQMEYLAANHPVVPLDELLLALKERRAVPYGTIAITFDDGWRDTYTNAFPVLKRLGLPATVFLATKYIESHDLFWSDRLSHSLAALNSVRAHRERIFTLVRSSPEIPPPFAAQFLEAIGLPPGTISASEIDACVESMKDAPPAQRRAIVDSLTELTREHTAKHPERMFMTWDEVREMALHRMTFGSHSHNHSRMTELNSAQLSDEVIHSLSELREHHLKPSLAFCYPGGYHNAETQRALRDKEISFAVLASSRSDLGANPRLIGRINIHEDVTNSTPLFAFRIWSSFSLRPHSMGW